MQIDRNLKVGVISSLIATFVFLYLLQPTLTLLGRIFLVIVGTVSTTYLDRLYSETASGAPDFAYYLWGLIVVATGKASADVLGRRMYWSLPAESRRGLIRPWQVGWMPLGALFLLGILFLADSSVRLGTVSTFQQHLAILAPSVSDEELKQLRADFASMKGKGDYDRLEAKVHQLAASKGITLPTNKLYPPPGW